MNRYENRLKIRYGRVMQDMLYFWCYIAALSEVKRSKYEWEEMGHSDVGVTLNTYTHLDFDDIQKEMKEVCKR